MVYINSYYTCEVSMTFNYNTPNDYERCRLITATIDHTGGSSGVDGVKTGQAQVVLVYMLIVLETMTRLCRMMDFITCIFRCIKWKLKMHNIMHLLLINQKKY